MLKLHISEERTTEFDTHILAPSVKIRNLPSRETLERIEKEFYGDYASTEDIIPSKCP
jgi:hypothetical protein